MPLFASDFGKYPIDEEKPENEAGFTNDGDVVAQTEETDTRVMEADNTATADGVASAGMLMSCAIVNAGLPPICLAQFWISGES